MTRHCSAKVTHFNPDQQIHSKTSGHKQRFHKLLIRQCHVEKDYRQLTKTNQNKPKQKTKRNEKKQNENHCQSYTRKVVMKFFISRKAGGFGECDKPAFSSLHTLHFFKQVLQMFPKAVSVSHPKFRKLSRH